MKKVVFCSPSLAGPTAPFIESLEASIPLVLDGGEWEDGYVEEVGNQYISGARSTMLRKALDAKADAIVFLDYDLSWEPHALRQLIDTPGDVVAGTYRFKEEPEGYMGLPDFAPDGSPIVRTDGCVKAKTVPGGFLKLTTDAVEKFMTGYPELCYGPKYHQYVDLFNHGAIEGTWWGEDYAFCLRWTKLGEPIWIIPDLNITHHLVDKKDYSITQSYPGNFHQHLMRLPGGSLSDNPEPPMMSAA